MGTGFQVQDKTTGAIWLLHTRNNTRLFLSHSSDDGAAWSDPIDVTETLKFGFPSERWIGTGHAGNQLQRDGCVHNMRGLIRKIQPVFAVLSRLLSGDCAVMQEGSNCLRVPVRAG